MCIGKSEKMIQLSKMLSINSGTITHQADIKQLEAT